MFVTHWECFGFKNLESPAYAVFVGMISGQQTQKGLSCLFRVVAYFSRFGSYEERLRGLNPIPGAVEGAKP
jgi:hypothetical protein